MNVTFRVEKPSAIADLHSTTTPHNGVNRNVTGNVLPLNPFFTVEIRYRSRYAQYSLVRARNILGKGEERFGGDAVDAARLARSMRVLSSA